VIATFAAPEGLMRYVVPKGSIAVDGVSLTVVEVSGEEFTVTLIPHTQEATLLTRKPLGGAVNLEADVLAKYVERAVAYASRGGPAGPVGPAVGTHAGRGSE
jgi:riboflavin synthase